MKDTYGGTYKIPKSATNPTPMGYRPGKDMSEPLSPKLSSYYKYLIGVMRRMVDIRRIDIDTKISLLSYHNAYPREGHFETVLHVMDI